ncbi:MAG: xanthine dehydrogenase accessory protein XdhC [Arenicellales bacterium WSBS_2016_MAG_OTU3]
MNIWSILLKAVLGHGRCAMVTVARLQGSAPREAGARMVVLPSGGFYGTIGGGALEYEAINNAQNILVQEEIGVRLTRQVLGSDLGQCCGGVVQLLIECFDQDRIPELESLSSREANGQFFMLGEIQKNRVVRNVTENKCGPEQQSFVLQDDGRVYETFGVTKRMLYLFGAGHVGRSVVLALAQLDFTVNWIDSRTDQFPAAVPSNTQICVTDTPVEILQNAPDDSFIVVMTHSHSLDLDIIYAALKQLRFAYVGLIGSASKRAKFLKRLREGGMNNKRLTQFVCPIGVKGIGSKQPAAIAASLVAQLLIEDERIRSEAPRKLGTQANQLKPYFYAAVPH